MVQKPGSRWRGSGRSDTRNAAKVILLGDNTSGVSVSQRLLRGCARTLVICVAAWSPGIWQLTADVHAHEHHHGKDRKNPRALPHEREEWNAEETCGKAEKGKERDRRL